VACDNAQNGMILYDLSVHYGDILGAQDSSLFELTRDEINALIAFMETLSTNTQRTNLIKMPK
jgi:hypothetical protein